MTMEIKMLKMKIETDTFSYKALKGVVDQLKENEIHLKMELENEKKETEKQHHLIIKLQTEERELTKHSVSKHEEMLSLMSLNRESEKKQRLLITQTEGLMAERDLASQNLLKAQVELRQNSMTTQTTIQNLQAEVKILNREADEKKEVLAKAERDYCSVKKQLELELAETKNMHETFKETQALLDTIKLDEVRAELEKVMLHHNKTVVLLEEKNAEIECLTSIPENAFLKIKQCQWDLRDLNKKLKAVKGHSMMYESKYKSEEKKNKELTDDLRQVKLELGRKHILPSISKKPQPPTEDKPKDECKPMLRHTRIPLIKSKCLSEEHLPVILLPSISKVQCREVNITSRPTPPPFHLPQINITPCPTPPPFPLPQIGRSQRTARRLSVVSSHQ
ncbi:coiled-coil domain-containing protein 6-like [Cebidichthys violaceus]|uniref:coiled-coil domain-containing protein 6-like n=1 Tax=Cebidichthys violaceus TaxID=271503 RepID=UPI0035CC8A14